jgi:hypothetical protein
LRQFSQCQRLCYNFATKQHSQSGASFSSILYSEEKNPEGVQLLAVYGTLFTTRITGLGSEALWFQPIIAHIINSPVKEHRMLNGELTHINGHDYALQHITRAHDNTKDGIVVPSSTSESQRQELATAPLLQDIGDQLV